MTYEEIQISKDSELMIQVISLIASYAVENDMSPNETIKTVAENMLGLLKIVTFENWEKKTLPSVISTSEDCVSRKSLLDKLDPLYEKKIKTAPDNMAEGFVQIANLIKNEPPVTPSQDWIPVSEGLPKPQKDGDSNFTDWVQVSIRINPYQSIVCSAYYCFSEAKWYMERMGCGEIVAWQPLPKAYEEKRGSENEVN